MVGEPQTSQLGVALFAYDQMLEETTGFWGHALELATTAILIYACWRLHRAVRSTSSRVMVGSFMGGVSLTAIFVVLFLSLGYFDPKEWPSWVGAYLNSFGTVLSIVSFIGAVAFYLTIHSLVTTASRATDMTIHGAVNKDFPADAKERRG